MCGIAGVLGPKASEALALRMGNSIAHRGPDGSGVFADGEAALSHRRLSIIDLSENGRQPMTTADGRFTITYNGEVYNYLELRAELGGEFVSTSDTEVMLKAFEKWGIKAVEKFNGMFAFAIWDKRERVLTCVRDRMGIKPFYYHFDGQNFFFASEIKALLEAGVEARPHEAIIIDYLASAIYDHTDETFFEGIHKLPPGHYFQLKSGQTPKAQMYWNLPERAAGIAVPKNDAEAIRLFRELFEDAIRLRLRSDVPVGVNLSSGLDSTALLAYLKAIHPDISKLHAFTATYRDEKYDEGRLAKPLADSFGLPWHSAPLEIEDFEAVAAKTMRSQDEPYGGVPQLGFYQLNRVERENGVTVLLEGHGVEEYLTGYPMFLPPYWSDLLGGGHLPTLAKELSGYVKQGRGDLKKAIGEWRSFMSHREGLHLDLTRQTEAQVLSKEYAMKHHQVREQEKPFPTHLENALYHNLKHAKLPRVLRFQDRMSMAHGRELRLPFLDYRLVELGFAMPGHLKIRNGVDKYILRESLHGLVPKEVLERPKSYVVTPQTAWLKNELRPYVESITRSESFKSRPCFDQAGVQERLKSFYADPKPKNSFGIWQLVNLEQWYRAYID